MSLSLAFNRYPYTIAMPNSRGGRSEAQHNIQYQAVEVAAQPGPEVRAQGWPGAPGRCLIF